MKANKKQLNKNSEAAINMQVAITIVGLLLAIVIGVMVYFNTIDNITEFAQTTEYFTGYTLPTDSAHTGGSNASVQHITLENSPYSTSNSTITVICYNATGATTSSPPVTINHKTITIPAASSHAGTTTSAVPKGYSQINVTYTSKIARAQSTDVTPMASTVFTLAPIIALVVIAAIVLVVVLGFGKGRRGL
jgi:cobalamin biosynthesis Mg chelatase CobN